MWKPIISLVIIITSVVFSVNYVLPEYERIQKLKADISVLDKVSKDQKKIDELTAETERILGEIPKDSDEKFSRLIPETVDYIRFANNIKALAFSRGIFLKDLQVVKDDPTKKIVVGGKETLLDSIKNTLTLDRASNTLAPNAEVPGASSGKNKKYVTTKATFAFVASYPTFLALLGDLEQSLEIINVTSLSLAPRKEIAGVVVKKPSVPLYEYQVEVETYSIK